MEILSFEIRGKMAHFRKYFANNTAFSFSIPPRTTLMGIVAAAMGWSKDSYYEKLASDKIQFAVRVLNPLKKSFHRLNLLSIKSLGNVAKHLSSDFRGENGRIQTPFEVISGWNISKNDVRFEVFLKATDLGTETFEEIKNHFLNKEPVYNISLGAANFSAQIKNVQVLNDDVIQKTDSDDFIELHSAVPVEQVDKLEFHKDQFENYNFVEEDMLPGDFKANGNREVVKMNKLLFSITENPLRVKLNSSFYQLKNKEEIINIQFMDQ